MWNLDCHSLTTWKLWVFGLQFLISRRMVSLTLQLGPTEVIIALDREEGIPLLGKMGGVRSEK